MAYTPINWQTGDTITAEKMNKMDNGWGVESTQLFSETVTTADDSGMIRGFLVYSDTIDADSIVVTFNGTDYTCPRIDAFDAHYYGGAGETGPDFSEIPFTIESVENSNTIYTQSAGEYAVTVSVAAIVVSNNFSEAVARAEEFAIVQGVTTFQEAADAFKSGKRACVLGSGNGKTAHYPIICVNENTYEIKFIVTTDADTDVGLAGLTASSADGVLS